MSFRVDGAKSRLDLSLPLGVAGEIVPLSVMSPNRPPANIPETKRWNHKRDLGAGRN